MAEKIRTDRIGYRSLDDLLAIVRAGVRLKPVQEMHVIAGIVVVRSVVPARAVEAPDLQAPEGSDPLGSLAPSGPPLFPPPKLPSDDALEKLRASQAEWGFVRARTMGAAFLSAIVRLQAAGLEPTHLLTGPGGLTAFLRVMGVPVDLLAKEPWARFSGLEVVEHPSLDDATYLVCGGYRVGGGVSELERAIRIECQKAPVGDA